MRLLLLVVLATGLATHGRAQLFPFSNLHNYFKSISGDGPGAHAGDDAGEEDPAPAAAAAASAVAPVPATTFVAPPPPADAPPARRAPPAPIALRPPSNHRLEEDVQPAEAAPVVGLRNAPFPSQVLQPPENAPAIDYGALLAAAAAAASLPSDSPVLAPSATFFPTPLPQEPSAAPGPVLFTPPQPSFVLLPPPETTDDLPVPTNPPQNLKLPIPNKSLYKNKPGAASYPKKYRPEKVAQKVVSSAEESVLKKKSAPPKKASATAPALTKEQLQFKQQQRQKQHVAATVEAASFQRPAAPPRPGPLAEQETAESGFAGVTLGAGHGHGSDRVEFQMHGQHGPHSYKWGYDTGKGHNRQFRYEERDTHGHVKGHYGFYDKHGKLQVVSYSADPEHGYHADGNFGKHGIA